MSSRRRFLSLSSISFLMCNKLPEMIARPASHKPADKMVPRVISTWDHGVGANAAAFEVLQNGGSALDAVEQGVRVPEADILVTSVGKGGYPDRDGKVTLDACIMDAAGNCGSVAFLSDITHAISVARLVKEKTPHVMLVGEGALEFALKHGFEREPLLTVKAEKAWKKWLQTADYEKKNVQDHDTIGMVAIDRQGNLSGACTTSGLAFKMHGRVGDSPIIGAGLYVDNDVGAATATGVGEAVIKICGSHLIVELMRQGSTPQEACEMAIQRLLNKYPQYQKDQVGFLAMNKAGEYGAYAIKTGFQYALRDEINNKLVNAESKL